MRNTLLQLSIALCGLTFCLPTFASTDSNQFQVTLTIVDSCTVDPAQHTAISQSPDVHCQRSANRSNRSYWLDPENDPLLQDNSIISRSDNVLVVEF